MQSKFFNCGKLTSLGGLFCVIYTSEEVHVWFQTLLFLFLCTILRLYVDLNAVKGFVFTYNVTVL